MPDFIRLNDVTFSYHSHAPLGTAALSGVNLHIARGEWVALIGTNGSGKSTLAKLLNALFLPTSGKVITAGMDTSVSANHIPIRTRVGMVFQRPQDQIVASTVEEEVAFGPANLGLPPREVRERVEQALDQANLQDLRERHPFFLSAGEAQRLALAGVLAMRPQCIIFDESTAMLDPANQAAVMRQAQSLHQQGITIIMITHIMQEAARCQRTVVLHRGNLVMDGPSRVVFSRAAELASFGLDQPYTLRASARLRRFFPALPDTILRTGELLEALPRFNGDASNTLSHQTPVSPVENNNPAIIQVADLSYTYLHSPQTARPALDGLSLRVAGGHIHGLIGASGSGKSTLLQHLNALIRPQKGHVMVADFDLTRADLDTRGLRRRVSLAFQQPEDQIFERYVGDEIAYGPRQLGYDGKLAEIVAGAMRAVGLDFETYKDRLTAELSGGEQRKVALASILAVRAEILLLDEPLAGLDPRSRGLILGLMADLQSTGKTLLVSSHQYEQLGHTVDALSVLHTGHDVLHGAPADVFSQDEVLRSAGIIPPIYTRIAQTLQQKGWPLPCTVIHIESLERALIEITKGVR